MAPKLVTKVLTALEDCKKVTAPFKIASIDSSGKVLGTKSGKVLGRRRFVT